MRTPWIVGALMVAMLAGCSGPDAPAVDAPMEEEYDEPVPTFGPHSGLPTERPADWRPRLDASPQWVLGEWWEVEVEDHFVGDSARIKVVAAGMEGRNYLVGMPRDEFHDVVMILHHPGIGLVHRDTLGYEQHDFMFEPARFPLEEGATWQTLWQSADNVLDVTVTEADEAAGTATIEATGSQPITMVYDAHIGFIREFHAPDYMTYRVVDHGFGYEGMVRVPHGHDLVFYHGRLGPAANVAFSQANNGGPVGGPTETITVSQQYDRSSFSLIIFELAPLLVDPATAAVGHGVYEITATAPDGTVYHASKLPPQGGHVIETFAHDLPAGDWHLEVVALGPAMVFMEGIAYVVFDVDLPSGCVVVTERVHDHGGECGGHVHGIQ